MRYVLSFAGFMSGPIYDAMEALYPEDDEASINRRVNEFREQQLLSQLHFGVRCIAGHVRFSQVAFDRFSPDYKFITTLRDPVELLVSSYFYSLRHNHSRWKCDSGIEEYLESERAKSFGEAYARFYSGLPLSVDARAGQSIEKAKANLLALAAVGFVDDMGKFERRLGDVLGIRLRIGHANRSVHGSERERTLTPEIRRKIEAISGPNIEIYEYARSRLAG